MPRRRPGSPPLPGGPTLRPAGLVVQRQRLNLHHRLLLVREPDADRPTLDTRRRLRRLSPFCGPWRENETLTASGFFPERATLRSAEPPQEGRREGRRHPTAGGWHSPVQGPLTQVPSEFCSPEGNMLGDALIKRRGPHFGEGGRRNAARQIDELASKDQAIKGATWPWFVRPDRRGDQTHTVALNPTLQRVGECLKGPLNPGVGGAEHSHEAPFDGAISLDFECDPADGL